MTHPGSMRQKLANVVTTWIAQRQGKGFGRLIAQNQNHAALSALVDALSELDEPLAGTLWSHAYQVAILWAQGLSIKNAMRKLINAYAQVVDGEEDLTGDVRNFARLQSLERVVRDPQYFT
jgi:hypothetical protein